MKYQKAFLFVCAVVILTTLTLLTLVALDIFKVIHLSSWMLLIVCMSAFIMLILSFACCCILQSLYDDWRTRRINNNAKWHR